MSVMYVAEVRIYKQTQIPPNFPMLCYVLFFITYVLWSADATEKLPATKWQQAVPSDDWTAESYAWYSPPALLRTESSAGHFI